MSGPPLPLMCFVGDRSCSLSPPRDKFHLLASTKVSTEKKKAKGAVGCAWPSPAVLLPTLPVGDGLRWRSHALSPGDAACQPFGVLYLYVWEQQRYSGTRVSPGPDCCPADRPRCPSSKQIPAGIWGRTRLRHPKVMSCQQGWGGSEGPGCSVHIIES